MHVLFLTRANLLESKAGDTVQILKTREYLQRIGIKVSLSSSCWIDLSDYHLVHLFNTNNINEILGQFRNCKKQGKSVALSTIYWDMKEYIQKDKNTSTTLDWWYRINQQKQELFQNADILLPNSRGEYLRLADDLAINNSFHVVPNGADKIFIQGNPNDFVKKYQLSNFVLCVARIAHRKNQLALIQGMKGTGIPVVFIGSQHNRHYLNLCRKEAEDEVNNFHFIQDLPHHSLPSAYSAARVHVLPSWFETPGLVSLEAALSGCAVVTTPLGTTKEYFKDMVEYCEPAKPENIRETVLAAMKKGPNSELKKHVIDNYTWEKTAEETLKAYETVLKKP